MIKERRELIQKAIKKAFEMPAEVFKVLIGYNTLFVIILIFLRFIIGIEFYVDNLLAAASIALLMPLIGFIIYFFDIYKKLKKEEEKRIEKVNFTNSLFAQGDLFVAPKKHKDHEKFFTTLNNLCEIKYYAHFTKDKEDKIEIFIIINDKEIIYEEIEKENFSEFYHIAGLK